MMAFDRTSPRPALEPEVAESLRAALSRSVAQGDHVPDLRERLCRASADARSKGIQAEQLLLILKDLWYSLPEVAGAASPDVENALLQEVISRCIQEYYAI